jgi:hypothetical protein
VVLIGADLGVGVGGLTLVVFGHGVSLVGMGVEIVDVELEDNVVLGVAVVDV